MSAATPTDSLLAKLATPKGVAGSFAGLVAVVLLGAMLRGSEADRETLRTELVETRKAHVETLTAIRDAVRDLATQEAAHARAAENLAALAANRSRP